PRRDEIAAQMVALGLVHGRIELDQHLAGLDALPIAHMDRAHHSGLERLDDLGAPAGDDLSRCRRNDVDLAERRPYERQAEHGDDGYADGAANWRGRRLDDLERRRQERELVSSAP